MSSAAFSSGDLLLNILDLSSISLLAEYPIPYPPTIPKVINNDKFKAKIGTVQYIASARPANANEAINKATFNAVPLEVGF